MAIHMISLIKSSTMDPWLLGGCYLWH